MTENGAAAVMAAPRVRVSRKIRVRVFRKMLEVPV